MKPEDFGYNHYLGKLGKNISPDCCETARVIAEHRERYIVKTVEGEMEAEITGNLRYTATGRGDFPAVGDWVAIIPYERDFVLIHKILPRFSAIKRQAAGKTGEVQIIAANIDVAFIVQAVDRDFNVNRLERYLIICNSSNVEPVIVLTKTDLADERRISNVKDSIERRMKQISVFLISNETQLGYDELKQFIQRGKTYCMLGSSGVGKSTLLNNLSGKNIMRTGAISESTSKGRHITSHRELIILDEGGILIDNPGMREVGIADTARGLEVTFNSITSLSSQCKFKDCTHTGETGCAVLEALKNGKLDRDAYVNYMKMEKEKFHFETTVAEKRKREKIFGKIVKDYYKKGFK